MRVLVVRPGFAKTRMTAGLPPAPFPTTREVVTAATVGAPAGQADTIWVPERLRLRETRPGGRSDGRGERTAGVRPRAGDRPRCGEARPDVRTMA